MRVMEQINVLEKVEKTLDKILASTKEEMAAKNSESQVVSEIPSQDVK